MSEKLIKIILLFMLCQVQKNSLLALAVAINVAHSKAIDYCMEKTDGRI